MKAFRTSVKSAFEPVFGFKNNRRIIFKWICSWKGKLQEIIIKILENNNLITFPEFHSV